MAVYHYDARTLTKSHGDSALGHHDYMCAHGQSQSSKDRIVYTGSGNMPKWAKDEPREYWEATDLYERQNGRLCKSLTIALPQELDLEDNQKLIEEYANHVTTLQNGKRLPFSYAVHADATTGHNPHLHLIISERITDEIDRLPSDHFKRYNSKAVEKGGSQKTDELKPREWLLNQRETWANICNTELEKHGIKAIDHRSLKDRGIDREPNKHLGPRCSKEKKAIEKQLFSLENEIESIKQSISELESQAKNAAVIEMEATHELKSLDRYEKIEAENKAPMLSEQPKALIAIKLREAPMLTEQQAVHSEKIREAPMLSPAKPEAAAGVSRSEKKSDTPRPHHSGGHETVSRTKAEAMIAEMDLRLKKLQKKYNDQAKADQDMANKIYWAEKNLLKIHAVHWTPPHIRNSWRNKQRLQSGMSRPRRLKNEKPLNC